MKAKLSAFNFHVFGIGMNVPCKKKIEKGICYES